MTTIVGDALIAGTIAALVRGNVNGPVRLVLDCVLRRQPPAARAEALPIVITPVKQGFRIEAHGLQPFVIANLKWQTLNQALVRKEMARSPSRATGPSLSTAASLNKCSARPLPPLAG